MSAYIDDDFEDTFDEAPAVEEEVVEPAETDRRARVDAVLNYDLETFEERLARYWSRVGRTGDPDLDVVFESLFPEG